MPTFIRGNDRGYAILSALVLILLLSAFLSAAVPRIDVIVNLTNRNREQLMQKIEQSGREVLDYHDLY